METYQHTVTINAPRETVHAFGTDPANWMKTSPGLVRLDVTEQTETGTQMDATYRILTQKFDGEMTLEIVEPNEHTVASFVSPEMTGKMHWHYADAGDATEVRMDVEYEFGHSLRSRILSPIAKRYNERQFRQTLENSKDMIEATTHVQQPVEV